VLKATLKGIAAHKLRLALTALAVILGVSFVAGTYVLTDTISNTFTELFQTTTKGTDVAVRSRAAISSPDQGGFQTRDPMPQALVEQVAAVDGVKAAEGSVSGFAQFIGKDGKPVTTGGAPTLGVSISSVPELRGATELRSGRYPSGPGEVAMDAATARKHKFAAGDRVKVLLQGPARTFTLVGTIGFGQADNLAGATLAGFDLATAQQVLDRQGKYDEIDVVAAPGVSQEALRDRVAAAIDPRYEALTGKQLAKESADSISKGLGRFLSTALLAFAGVALFVGAFIIFNTFSIIVAQRTRELALLRCLGASRRQVLTSVLTESAVVGVVASVVGLGLGVLVAQGLRALLKAFGADLPTSATQVLPRTVVVALVVGVGVTVLSSVVPALKATRVPPVAALREEAAVAPARSGRRRTVVGVLVTGLGVALLLLGLFKDAGNRLANVGAGALVIFLGIAVLSPLVARPLARLIGWPFASAFREPGKLARQNAMRNPRRTASTAAALMIGLALVTFVSIFAASIKASATQVLDKSVAADYILNTKQFQPFSTQVAERLAKLPELEAVAATRVGPFKLHGQTKTLTAADPTAYARVVRTETTAGSLSDLAGPAGGLAVKDTVAKANGWKLGTSVPMEFLSTGVQQVPVRAIYKDNNVNGDYLLPLSLYQRNFSTQADQQVLAKAAPGVSPDASRAAIDRVLADFPNVEVRDQAEYKAEQARQIDQLLGLVSALLGLAILIALFGIVNTLALSIFERVRELGLLRAIGMTRGQLRRMVRWEAVIIAVLGAVLGLAVGAFFGWAMVRALAKQGISEFAVPVGQLVGYVLAAGVAGVLAAVLPGRRAAKVDMLRAITTE
jgi:putative ABC transport system permease protein